MSWDHFFKDLHHRQKGPKAEQIHHSDSSKALRHRHHYRPRLFGLCRFHRYRNRWVTQTINRHPLSAKTYCLFNAILGLQTMISYQTKSAVHFSSMLLFSLARSSFSVFLPASTQKDYCELCYQPNYLAAEFVKATLPTSVLFATFTCSPFSILFFPIASPFYRGPTMF